MGKIIVDVRTNQARGIGPSSKGAGGLSGNRISSPYDDPLICQYPIEGSKDIDEQIAEQKIRKIDAVAICASKDPQIATTTEIGTTTL